MPKVGGRIVTIQTHEEEGRTDWPLAACKICWFGICVLAPISLFRLVADLFNTAIAVAAILFILVLIRLLGPSNLVMFDELLCRIFPSLRTAVRTGRLRVYDLRVQEQSGRQVACVLPGDLKGGAPMEGDLVVLDGIYRGGTFWVDHGQDLTTASTFAPRSVHTGWLLAATLGLVILFALYLCGLFDRWLYPLVAHWLRFLEAES